MVLADAKAHNLRVAPPFAVSVRRSPLDLAIPVGASKNRQKIL
jgi:hypothetical protein